jgi:hypothetical protein
MLVEPSGESPFYGCFTDEGFLFLSCGLEGAFLVELDEEDADYLRRAQDITRLLLEARPRGSRGPTPASGTVGAGARKVLSSGRDPAAGAPAGTGREDRGSDPPPILRDRKPAAKRGNKTPRKRLKPGDAALKICAALNSLAAQGKWNVLEDEIIERARVARSTYFRVKRLDEDVKEAMELYLDRRLGRGPVHARDV